MNDRKQLPLVIVEHITPLAVTWLEEFLAQFKDQGMSIQVSCGLHVITLPLHWTLEEYTNDVWLINANDQYQRTFRWSVSPDDLRHSWLDVFLESDFLVITCQPHQQDQVALLQEHIPSLYLASEDPSGECVYECPFRLLPVPYSQLALWLEQGAFQGAYRYSEESVCPKKHAGPAVTTMLYSRIRVQHYLEFYQVTAKDAAHANALIEQGLVQPYYSELVKGDGVIL